jgi:hypothetical protein
MPIDPSIPLSVKQPQIEDPTNALMRVLQIQGLQDARTREQRALDQQTAMNDAYSGALGADGKLDENKLYSLLSGKGQGSQIPGVQKSLAEVGKIKSETDKNSATATKDTAEAENKTIAMYRDASTAITDPASAVEFVKHMHTDPRLANSAIARVPLDQAIAQIPQDPAQLAAWKQQFALGAAKFMELNKPTTNVVAAGGTSQILQTPGLGGTPQTVATVAHTQSPDNAATIAGENKRSADTLRKDYVVAGFSPDGAPTGDIETTAQAIARGQLPPPSGMALTNPKNQRILSRVMEINPEYDYTTVTAKKAAATGFTSGAQGNQLRSFQVAGQHLDQLGQLIDALHNNDLPMVNKLGNMFSQQTGSPIVTNFDAAKDVVSKEVMKAIVAGGGGEGERAALKNSLDAAKSPAQLKGVVQQYRNLMSAQADALMEQRRAAGLPDSTLPKYGTPAGGAAPARVTSAADYANVPKGAQYIAPDGTTRTKQ